MDEPTVESLEFKLGNGWVHVIRASFKWLSEQRVYLGDYWCSFNPADRAYATIRDEKELKEQILRSYEATWWERNGFGCM
jgi:hypothetical protein